MQLRREERWSKKIDSPPNKICINKSLLNIGSRIRLTLKANVLYGPYAENAEKITFCCCCCFLSKLPGPKMPSEKHMMSPGAVLQCKAPCGHPSVLGSGICKAGHSWWSLAGKFFHLGMETLRREVLKFVVSPAPLTMLEQQVSSSCKLESCTVNTMPIQPFNSYALNIFFWAVHHTRHWG